LTFLLHLLLALLVIAPLSTGATGATAQKKRCKTCKEERLLECEQHHRIDLTHEAEVIYCSVVDGCEVCGGTGWLACPECDDGSLAEELRQRAGRIALARRGLASIDETMGRSLRKGETQHFILVWEMLGMKVEKERLTEHQMMHLTLERLERLYTDYVTLFGLDDTVFDKKFRIFVWHLPEDHRRGSLAFCDLYSPSGSKLMGINPNYSVCGDKRYFLTDEKLHRNLIHCTTHLIFSHQRPSAWIGNLNAGWADEGLAHYFEHLYFGMCDNYCYEESNTQMGFKGGKFKPALYKLADAETMPPVATVVQKNSTDLEPAEHAVALAVTEYLIGIDPIKFDALGRKLRERGVLRDELKAIYGFSILELQTRLQAWVLASYPNR
jgi:hypothetical protein